MDGSAGLVTAQLRQIECFRHDSLAGEGGVAVQQQAQDALALFVALLALLGPDLAQDDRIDGFQVAGIGGERQMDAIAVEIAVGGSAQMIFHVARALNVLRVGGVALEL